MKMVYSYCRNPDIRGLLICPEAGYIEDQVARSRSIRSSI